MDLSDLMVASSDEDEPTASKVLQSLTTAWINEKLSPQLMQHKSNLVDCMMEQIHQMEENLQNLNRDDFRLVPCQMEVDRIRYIISSYLRIRLEKIETFTTFLLKRDRSVENENERYLSTAEFNFAEEFMSNMKTHCHNEAVKYMPSLLQEYGEGVPDMEVKPNLNSVVFIRMVKSVSKALIDEQIVNLSSGSRHLLPYKDVIEYIENGSALLI